MDTGRQNPPPFYSGKVRDLYPVDAGSFLMVASDRISAFDVVFASPIPGKGVILTEISRLWFAALRSSGLYKKFDFSDHLVSIVADEIPAPYNIPAFSGRSMHVRRVNRIDFECVVRGYLAGSAYKDYRETGAVCGQPLPAGLSLGSPLPETIFTPATKAPLGQHDVNVPIQAMAKALGSELTGRLEAIAVAVYTFAREKMEAAGILLCDTKFEFGLDQAGRIVLIDEVLTPDSSRYWDAASHRIGHSPPGYDKQYIRDYLEGIGWDKTPPPPDLPPEVIRKTQSLYGTIEQKIRAALTRQAPTDR